MFIGRVNSTSFNNAKNRIVKFLGFGKNDVQGQKEAAPYGVDSNPIKGMQAIYAPTANGSESIVIGYINKNQLADVGEMRVYSTNSDGDLKAYVWCKADGKLKLNGDADNAIRYSKLDSSLQDFKSLIQAELVKIQTGLAGVGGSYTPGTLIIDTSQAKIDEILTP